MLYCKKRAKVAIIQLDVAQKQLEIEDDEIMEGIKVLNAKI